MVTGESSFMESGTTRFGEGNRQLPFSAIGQGYLGTSTDRKLRHGSVIWRLENGEGQFRGASGLITSNFTINETDEVIDQHFGVIIVRQAQPPRAFRTHGGEIVDNSKAPVAPQHIALALWSVGSETAKLYWTQ